MLVVIGLTVLIAWLYIATNGELTRQAFYILPIILAVSWLGLWWGLGVAIWSAIIRMYGDHAYAGVEFGMSDRFFHAMANRLSLLLAYIVVAVLLHELFNLSRQLEQRVQARTTALRQAVAAREKLQSSLIEAGLRERAAIGRDVHDGLGQHLTATLMASNILAKRLEQRGDALAADARAVELLLKESIEQSRKIARGLLLETVKPAEFLSELEELAVATAQESRTDCVFSCEGEAECLDVNITSHLFYIAREAVRNAVRHGGATRIAIQFKAHRLLAALVITDNGRGLNEADRLGGGVGLGIMAQRAEIIGGSLQIEPNPGGGTRVDCRVPLPQSA